jgi:hypothetical protein
MVSEDLQIRMNQFQEALIMEDINDATENLEKFLQDFADTPQIPRFEGDLSLDDPVLLLIAQARCERICRTELFCPFPECHEPIRSNGALSTHLNRKHDLPNQYCRDPMHHFLHRMCPTEIYVMLRTPGGETVDRRWDMERCPFLVCEYFQERRCCVEKHVLKHVDLPQT